VPSPIERSKGEGRGKEISLRRGESHKNKENCDVFAGVFNDFGSHDLVRVRHWAETLTQTERQREREVRRQSISVCQVFRIILTDSI
jgi:hypothetical protein